MMASTSAHTKLPLMTINALSLVLIIICSATNLANPMAGVAAASGDNDIDQDMAMRARYERWVVKHGRTYKDHNEKAQRYKVFRSNAELVDSYNAAAATAAARGKSSKSSPRLATNKFSDLTDEEFKAMYLRLKDDVTRFEGSIPGFMYGSLSESDVPASRNWTAMGKVTPVKDQAQCGSCWAFSAVAAVEGIHAIKTHKLVPLSEQQLMDCSTGMNNRGCHEGDMEEAFLYISRQAGNCVGGPRPRHRHTPHHKGHHGDGDGGVDSMMSHCVSKKGGISAESDYPYRGVQSNCSTLTNHASAFIRGFQYVPANNETALRLAVSRQPVSLALDSNSNVFRHYKSGIFGAGGVVGSGCTNSSLNHALTAVGYGTDEHGTRYWLMKNSWGTEWGEGGYIRIARDLASDEAGVCGLAVQASYPVA